MRCFLYLFILGSALVFPPAAASQIPPSTSRTTRSETATESPEELIDAARHSINIVSNGNTLVPILPTGVSGYSTYPEQLNQIFSHAREAKATRIVVFVHGGLNTVGTGRRRVAELVKKMEADNCYPIFINWDSGLWSTVGESLLAHQGRIAPVNLLNEVTWGPLNLTTNFATAAVRTPLYTANYVPTTVWYQLHFNLSTLYSDGSSTPIPWHLQRGITAVNNQTRALYQRYHAVEGGGGDKPLQIGLGAYSLRKGQGVGSVLLAPVRIPMKICTTYLVNAFGKPAWDNMLRRTRVMFIQPTPQGNQMRKTPNNNAKQTQSTRRRPDKPANLNQSPDPYQRYGSNRGVVPQFMDSLVAFQRKQKRLLAPVTVDLIGHSMGAIVLNEATGNYCDSLEVTNLVYMGAACSIYDFRTKVVPYLQHHQQTRFYNLTLHPYREVSESHFCGLAPQGSLLCYIDELLSTPLTPQDRTLGRWHNFILATKDPDFLPADVRGRVTLKGFGASNNRDAGPQQHGQFGAFPFWHPCTWEVSAAACPPTIELNAVDWL